MLGPEQERERRHQKEMIKVHSLWKSAKEELTKALDELRHTKREADLAKRALDHVKVGPSASIPSPTSLPDPVSPAQTDADTDVDADVGTNSWYSFERCCRLPLSPSPCNLRHIGDRERI
jgi:hypothetical protein